MPEDDCSYELIDGVLVLMVSPTRQHQVIVKRLFLLLDVSAPPEHEVLTGPLDVLITRTPARVRVPDAVVVPADTPGEARFSEVTYTLVAEVVSPGGCRRDEVEKRIDYAKAGVEHYWILDPEFGTVRILRLHGDAYREVAVLAGDESAEVEEPFPVTVRAADLFA